MKAARLYGARDMRIEEVDRPPAPGPDEAIVQVGSVGVCGSDLHTYLDGRIGDTVVQDPLILGHEFAGVVTAVGERARDGLHEPLAVGDRVAVEPTISCWHCDMCEQGHPNLCRNHWFMGLWPHDGALQEYVTVPARNCFKLPDALSLEVGALLEPLGVAIHAVDLAKIRIGQTVAVQGCGPIGLMIIKLAQLSGAGQVIALDQFAWRLAAARDWGADHVVDITQADPAAAVKALTGGRGVPVVIEAAWAGVAVSQAVEMADLGARIVLVGIPGEDDAFFTHSTARRKGLTLKLSRRMKHAYPRAIPLTVQGALDLEALVSHRFGLAGTGEAFEINAHYADDVLKVMVNPGE